jgi:hypothetical protein
MFPNEGLRHLYRSHNIARRAKYTRLGCARRLARVGREGVRIEFWANMLKGITCKANKDMVGIGNMNKGKEFVWRSRQNMLKIIFCGRL